MIFILFLNQTKSITMATELDFEFKFDLTIEPKVEVKQEPVSTKTLHEVSVENAKKFFEQSDYPLKEKSDLDKAREAFELRNGIKRKDRITSYVIGKVRIVYDGLDYHAHLLKPMLAAGFQYWKSLYEKEIAYARAMCYAQHVVSFGNYGQTIPPSATEYLSIKEYEKLKMEQQIAIKDATIDLDIIPKSVAPDKTDIKEQIQNREI